MPADRQAIGSGELRLKAANSNDAMRADLLHHFSQVPRCSFARDDGISQYLGSEAGIDRAPESPAMHIALHDNVPAIATEPMAGSSKSGFKLQREAFAAALLLHAIAAFAITFARVPMPDEAALIEGVTIVSVVVDAESDASQRASGDKETVETTVEDEPTPLEKPVETPVGPAQGPQPVQAKTEDILRDLPMPELGTAVPEILTARVDAVPKMEIAAPAAVEKPVDMPPVNEMTAVVQEREIEPRKQEPKKTLEKNRRLVEKRKTVKGNQGKDATDAIKGRKGAKDKNAVAADSSRGDASNRELGNAARSNYKGLVQKRLQRAKSRVRNPGKGKVVVAFTITASGGISGLRIARGSGNEKVDAAAFRIVNSAAPFPAIPSEAGKKSWAMSVPIQFK